jgi:hypothetical protein
MVPSSDAHGRLLARLEAEDSEKRAVEKAAPVDKLSRNWVLVIVVLSVAVIGVLVYQYLFAFDYVTPGVVSPSVGVFGIEPS